MILNTVAGPDLNVNQLYQIWTIRDTVFAFEQHADDVDADGIDLQANVTHWWYEDGGEVASYLRVIEKGEYVKITRVCTRKEQRGGGLSTKLMNEAIAAHPGRKIKITAQAYLEDWYASLGFVRTGENFLEAGIDHVPMSLN